MSDMEESKHGEESLSSPSEPAYDISDVRAALRTLLEEVKEQHSQEQPNADASSVDAAYCVVLTTLHKICTNLLKSPVNPAHLSLNLRNAAVVKKFGGFRGARDLLKFCGFQETEDAASHTLAVPASALESLRVKIDRAAVIVQRVKAEHSPPEAAVAEPVGPASTVVSPSGDAMTDVAAPSSVFLANADDESKDMNDFGDEASSSPISDESMKPDLEPTYNIGDVRNALKKLFSEVESTLPTPTENVTPLQVRMHALTIRDAYVQVLDTLIKITQNVLKSPVNPQHLRINLANAAVRKKFAQFEGAIDYLRFLGFAEDASVTSPNAAGDPQQLIVLPESMLTNEPVKLNRALTIINQQRTSNIITAEENEQRSMGGLPREIRVFDVNEADPSRLANPTLGGVDEYVEEGRNDMGLVLQANLAERKRVHEMSRTDVIITKAKQQELKDAMKRKYHRTLIKITFTDKIVGNREQQQGSGRFGNANRRGGGYVLGSKNDAAPSAAAVAAAAASTPVPMDVDPLTHLSNAAVADASPQVVSPAAASTPSVTSPTAPAAPPAPELLVCAYFRPWETLGDLFSFMQRELLVHGAGTDPFYLHLPPNLRFQCGGDDKGGKNKALEEKTLQSLGLVPAAGLMFHYCAGSSASDVPGAVVDSLREEIRVSKEPYDAPLVATLVPQAENKAELEALKQKMLLETRERERILNGEGGSSSSSSAAAGASLADDADGDIEAYMRKKKAAAARSSSSSSMPKTGGNALGGSSSGAGSAASKRNIAGLFKPK